MDLGRLGLATLQSRVESWECDFNDHWNARFYVRSFQLAAEAVTTPPGEVSKGARLVNRRHVRFHRELLAGDPVEVRSVVVDDGPHQGATVHLLSSDGRLAATAMERLLGVGEPLPRISAKSLELALPRLQSTADTVVATGSVVVKATLGPIRPTEVDHTGALLWEDIVRRLSLAAHRHITHLGFTPEFIRQNRINRTSVEMRIERHAEAAVGTCLRARTRLVSVSRKSFSTENQIETDDGVLLASIRQNLIVLDLTTRRAVLTPEFLRAASNYPNLLE